MLHIQQTTPGRWLAATIQGRLLIVECTDPTTEFIDKVWAALTDGTEGQSVLNLVTHGGILAAPAFALVTWDEKDQSALGQVRFIVRGSVRIAVQTDAGSRQLSADGVSTWLEQLIDDVTGFEVDVSDESDATAGVFLPLITGTAWVSRVRTPGAAEAPVESDEPAFEAEEPVVVDELTAAEEPVAAEPVAEEPVASEETIAEETIAGPSALSSAAASAAASAASSAAASESTVSGYIDATMIRSASEQPAAPSTAPSIADVGDHDGMTVMSGDIHKMREEHAGPEHFVLRIDGGATEELTDLALVGRAPSVSKVSGDRVPKLITVGSADQDISRNHVQFAVEGDTVVVTDLHSRNGTLIILPGKPPQKLRQGEPTSVIVGTVVDLGGGVTMTVGNQ